MLPNIRASFWSAVACVCVCVCVSWLSLASLSHLTVGILQSSELIWNTPFFKQFSFGLRQKIIIKKKGGHCHPAAFSLNNLITIGSVRKCLQTHTHTHTHTHTQFFLTLIVCIRQDVTGAGPYVNRVTAPHRLSFLTALLQNYHHLIILWLSNHSLAFSVDGQRDKVAHCTQINNSLMGWAGKHLVWHHRWEFSLKLFDQKCYLKASERHCRLVIMCFEWSLRMKQWNSEAIFPLRGQTGRRGSWGCRREDEEAAVQPEKDRLWSAPRCWHYPQISPASENMNQPT